MGGGRNEEDGDGNGEAESGESMESDRGGALSERAFGSENTAEAIE
jgi:hypothetical protein